MISFCSKLGNNTSYFRSERVKEALREVQDIPKTTTISYSSSTPWNSTGFYYSPRYPQSHRGTIIFGAKIQIFYFDFFLQGQPRLITTRMREGIMTTLTITIRMPTS